MSNKRNLAAVPKKVRSQRRREGNKLIDQIKLHQFHSGKPEAFNVSLPLNKDEIERLALIFPELLIVSNKTKLVLIRPTEDQMSHIQSIIAQIGEFIVNLAPGDVVDYATEIVLTMGHVKAIRKAFKLDHKIMLKPVGCNLHIEIPALPKKETVTENVN